MQQYQTFAGGYGTFELDKLEEKYAGFGGAKPYKPSDSYLTQLWINLEDRKRDFLAFQKNIVDGVDFHMRADMDNKGASVDSVYGMPNANTEKKQWHKTGHQPTHHLRLDVKGGKLKDMEYER